MHKPRSSSSIFGAFRFYGARRNREELPSRKNQAWPIPLLGGFRSMFAIRMNITNLWTVATLLLIAIPTSVKAGESFQALTACHGLEASAPMAELDQRLSGLAQLEATANTAYKNFTASCNAYLAAPQQTLSAMRSMSYDSQFAVESYKAYGEAVNGSQTFTQKLIPTADALKLNACKQALSAWSKKLAAVSDQIRAAASAASCRER